MAKEILDVLADLRAQRAPHAVATVVETRGSVSAKTGSKAVIDDTGDLIAGWVGGGCAESTTCQAALDCISSGETTILDIDLDDEVLGVGMPCGGSMRVYIEPMLPRPTLWIMGHGRVGECLCQLGDLAGLEVVVNDPAVTREKYPAAARLITDDIDYRELKPRADDYVVIATQHKGDHESMQRALAANPGYIALIASRKRSRLVLDYLRQEGFAQQDLEKVVAPAGLDLGARTPEEIALCVISEIVMLRRGGSGMRMRDKIEAGEAPARAAG
ncbi:MAG: XdhC family protein [Gammaproteobacteria bacterium]|nr:XdhC family protein [Gammaproteobacteria bacterium]